MENKYEKKKMENRWSLKLLQMMLVEHNIPIKKARKLAKAIDSLNTYEYNSLVRILKPVNKDCGWEDL